MSSRLFLVWIALVFGITLSPVCVLAETPTTDPVSEDSSTAEMALARVDNLSKPVKKLREAYTEVLKIDQTLFIELVFTLQTELRKELGRLIEKQLRLFELGKDASAESLTTTLTAMKDRGMDTTEFGQVLVVATGNLLDETVDTKVALGLLRKVFRAAANWLDDNVLLILYRVMTFVLILFAFKLLAGIIGRPVDRVEAIFNEIVAADERVLKESAPLVEMHKLSDYAVEFIVRPWVHTTGYWPVYWDLTRAVKQRLDMEGMPVPHPQRDVFIRREA